MEKWHYPYIVQKVLIEEGIEIAFIDVGKGEQTLLFVHGLGSNLKAWQKNIDFLSQNYRCIALDLPGFGKSTKGRFDFTISFFVNSIWGVIRQLRLKNISLVGHSMGGQIALQAVLKREALFSSLILIAPAGFETFSEQDKSYLEEIYQPSFLLGLSQKQIEKNFHLNFYDMPEDARFMIQDRLMMRETLDYLHLCEMIPKCVRGMLQEPVFHKLGKINLPTFILFGENDQLIPNQFLHPNYSTIQMANAGKNEIPNSQLHILSEAGHFVHWDQVAQSNRQIQNFLIQSTLLKNID